MSNEESQGAKKIIEVNELKVGGYIVNENEAFKITDIAHSKAGKHGSAKFRIEAVSVIGHKRISVVHGAGSKVEVPLIEKHTAQVLTLEDRVETRGMETIKKKIANVMDSDNYETFDMEVPEEMIPDVKEGVKVMYWDVLGAKLMKQIVP